MDPFEEFEFKPLTEGLGFHKKKAAGAKFVKEEEQETFSSQKFIRDQGLSLLDENPSTTPLSATLPRKKSPNTSAPSALMEETLDITSPSAGAVDEILKTLQKNRRMNIDEEAPKNKVNAPTFTKHKVAPQKIAAKTAPVNIAHKEQPKETAWSFSAGILDTMLVVAASLLCMIILLVITKVDLIGNLTHPDAYGMIYLATFGIFATVSFVYLTANRVFLGYTPGEWAFDQQVGKDADLNTAAFSLRVIARSLLVIATGFILFPIISMILNKDFAGKVSGAKLYRKG